MKAVMTNDIRYCRRKAVECAIQAEEASDTEVREYFLRMRDVWNTMSDRFDLVDSPFGRKEAGGDLSRLQWGQRETTDHFIISQKEPTMTRRYLRGASKD